MTAIVIIGVATILILFYSPAVLYFKKGWFKRFYHDVLKWHQPDDSPKRYDGCSMHSKCKWCGEEIMQDSQGNWF